VQLKLLSIFYFSPLHGLINTVYFCWSFGFVLFRAVTLSLCASRIYDESLLPKRVLYDVPPESYKGEVRKYVLVKFCFIIL
jgi:hypothetical protein